MIIVSPVPGKVIALCKWAAAHEPIRSMDKDDDEAERQWIKINNMQGKYDILMNMI